MEVDLDGNGTIEVNHHRVSSVIHFYCFIQFPEFLEMMKTKANEVDQGAELRYNIWS